MVLRDTLMHLAHHRGQLTVYLRLNDATVPVQREMGQFGKLRPDHPITVHHGAHEYANRPPEVAYISSSCQTTIESAAALRSK